MRLFVTLLPPTCPGQWDCERSLPRSDRCVGCGAGLAGCSAPANLVFPPLLPQMGSRCPCRRWSRSRTAPGTRPPASGSARAWRCACARWRRRTARCAGSSAWRRAAARRTATATTPRPTRWRREPGTARTSAPASWRAIAPSAGSSQSWRSVR